MADRTTEQHCAHGFYFPGGCLYCANQEIERLRNICADGLKQIDSNVAEIGRLRGDIESLKSYTGVYSQGWRSPYARPADDVGGSSAS